MHPLWEEITNHFVTLTDPRLDRGRNHNLLEMIFITLAATLCGANSWADVERFALRRKTWLEQFLDLEQGIPSHDTLGRVFARLDSAEFIAAFYGWVETFAGDLCGRGVAIDGKTLRGSFDAASGQSPLQLVTAFATDTRLVLRQLAVPPGENEIGTVPTLLNLMKLEGAIVTADAMHCQKQTARTILERGADYLLTVKRNQRELRQHLDALFQSYGERAYDVPGLKECVIDEQSHGRNERRVCYAIQAPKDDRVLQRWPGIQSVGMIYRETTTGGREHLEVAYFISSLRPSVRKQAQLLRDHWRIENCEHYILDVTFEEDRSRIRKGSGVEITAAFRRMALNILRRDTLVKDNIRGKRVQAAFDEEVLTTLISGFRRD